MTIRNLNLDNPSHILKELFFPSPFSPFIQYLLAVACKDWTYCFHIERFLVSPCIVWAWERMGKVTNIIVDMLNVLIHKSISCISINTYI